MPVGFNSPARNFFLLGSSGAELVTNFFKTITSPDSAFDAVYRAEEIRYDYGSDTYTLAGWGQDNNSTEYGWVENRSYNTETGGSTQTWRNLVKSSIANNDLRIQALEVDNGYGLVAVGIANDAPFIAKYDGNNGTLDFQSTSNSGNVVYNGIAVDINKNYYACGNTLVGNTVGFVEKYDSTGIPGWGKSASYEFSDVQLEKIAVNSEGGVVAVGTVFDDAGTKGYIVKLDALTGDVLWDKTLKRSSEDQVLDIILPRGVFIDSDDFIYVVGYFQDITADKSFIIKYSPEGNLLWQRETDDANGDPIQYYEVKADGNTGQVIVFGRYTDTFNNDELGLLTKYSRNGDLVWRRTIKSSYNQSLKFGFDGGAGIALDFDESFYYLLFTDDVLDVAGRTPEAYTFGKVSSSGNGLGQFEYSDGVGETMTYTIIEIPDRIGRIQDGSVRIETSGLVSYPFNANKLLFDDYATLLSNKKRQLEDDNVFQYSGSPAIRPFDFQELNLLGDVGTTEEVAATHNEIDSNNSTSYDLGTQRENDFRQQTIVTGLIGFTRIDIVILYNWTASNNGTLFQQTYLRDSSNNTVATGIGPGLSGNYSISADGLDPNEVYRIHHTSTSSNSSGFHQINAYGAIIWDGFETLAGTDGAWVDQSGKGNNAVVPYSQPGESGPTHNAAGYWEFDGFDDYISGSSPILFGTDTGSIEAWFKTSDTSTPGGAIYSESQSGDNTYWGHVRIHGGKPRFVLDDDSVIPEIEANVTVSDGNWHHVVVTGDGSNYAMYVDGVSYTPTYITGSGYKWFDDTPGLTTYTIGALERASIGNYFNGEIGEVRVYPRALTESQVFQNYNSTRYKYDGIAPNTSPRIGPGIVYDGLVLNYDFGNGFCIERLGTIQG